jgi:L-asparaginase
LNGALEGAQQAHAIALLKLVSVDDAALLDAVDDGPYKGLVIEAYGAGHIAEGLTEKVKALALKMPVVLCSQSAAGPMMERTYGYVGAELDLLNAGLLPGKHLNSKKTRLLLSLLLGAESGDVRADFVRLASLC